MLLEMIPRIIRNRLITRHNYHNSRILLTGTRIFKGSFAQTELVETKDDNLSHNDKLPGSYDEVNSKYKVVDNPDTSQDTGWIDKVLYSSYLEHFTPPKGFRSVLRGRFKDKEAERQEHVVKSSITPPVALSYLMESENEDQESNKIKTQGSDVVNEAEQENSVQFPFKIVNRTEFTDAHDADGKEADNEPVDSRSGLKLKSVGEKLKEQDIDLNSLLEEQPSVVDLFESAVEAAIVDAGTPDPSVPQSDVPCGGCGAFLHCQDKSIPGYISSEIFKKAKKSDLMEEVCYRCSVLETHQATLNVNVSAEDYPHIVNKIREKFAMALLLVDLTDFPCSIWPGIMDIIGTRRPIFLVGNKVDLLPQDSPDYLQRIEDQLIKCVVEIGMLEANIMHTALISAKTGFGVEDLISTIFNVWKGRGDVFIMGCTNVGKSSLFNMFLQSDLCKTKVSDLVQRATISQWPGTTLNLLKFPMTSPYGWKKTLRTRRLAAERPVRRATEYERLVEFKATKNPELVVLSEPVGKTFDSQQKHGKEVISLKDPFHVKITSKHMPHNVTKKPGNWNPDDQDFSQGHWVFDTPGAVNPNQILDLLTLPELMQSLPKTLIQPRSFFIKPSMSFFVGGLARVDYSEGIAPIRYTLFANLSLPVTMCRTCDADEIYQKGLGSKVFRVPAGSKERLAQFPTLKGQTTDFEGTGHNYSCSDIVLSSIGWISVTAARNHNFQLTVHTPDGKGIFIRKSSMLPYAVNWKGKRIRGSYSYLPHKLYVPRGYTWKS